MRWFSRLRLLVLLTLASSSAAAPPELSRIQLTVPDASRVALQLEAEGFDVLRESVQETSLDLVASPIEERELAGRGYAIRTIEVGRPYYEIQAEGPRAAVPSGYLDLDGILNSLQATADAHPSIASLVDLTATYGTPPTFENRHLYAIKISDNVTVREDEPAFLIVSAHHSRELVTPVIALDAVERLTSQYGIDPTITELVDGHEIWIAPIWNPDGYVEVFVGNNLWRKNRRVFLSGTGVDLNRNYPTGWNTACSGSTTVAFPTYKGPSPASEPETLTMIAWSEDMRFEKVIDFHSSGREVLWGYACPNHPWDAFLQGEATTLSIESGYLGAERPPSADGEHYQWQLAQGAGHAFLTETHSTFQPSFASAQAEAATVWPGTVYHLDQPAPVSGHVTDATTGAPLVASIDYPGVLFENGEANSSFTPFGRYHAFLPPGVHDITFSAPGYLPEDRTVVLGVGEAIVLDIALQELAPPVPGLTLVGRVGLIGALMIMTLIYSTRGRFTGAKPPSPRCD